MTFLLFVTIVSLLVAAVMSIVAWRIAGEERRRSEARVTVLASDIHGVDLDLAPMSFESEPIRTVSPHKGSDPLHSAPSADMFATAQPVESGSRVAIAVAIGVIVVGSLAMVGLLLSSGSHVARTTTTAAAGDARSTAPNTDHGASLANRANPVPLELVALGHERDGDRLTVRGVVHNPQSGTPVERLTAVVFLFTKDGNFITSGRTAVESPNLGPGGESRFVVTVPAGADVGRYRVSFRTDDRVVPHIDRREPTLAQR